MSAPAPQIALANQVTAIHANTLFAYQPDAFQSISLTTGSQWSTLPMGVSVNGSQAVVAQSGGQDALFIVGGRSNASTQAFPGFQKYSFDSNTWQALSPETSVAQNRVQHGAAFLQSTKSILIFGGSQDNSYSATAQTYTIGADEPYVMKSYGPGAPAVKNPILMAYNASHALMAGGGAAQEQIWTFSEADGWVMMTSTVPGGIADASKVQGAVTTDSSGNKKLELFDMSQSPNKVTTVDLSNKFHKRGPPAIVERDDTGAPTTTRSGFSLAQSNDMIVISGGTADKNAGSLAIFNSGKWQDPSSLFGNSVSPSGSQSVAANTFNASPGPEQSGPASASSGASASNGASASSGAPASGSQTASAAASSGASAASSGAPAASSGASAASSGASAASSGAASATNSAGSTATNSAAASSGSAQASGTSSSPTSTAAGAAGAAAASASAAAGGAGADSTTVILAAVLGSFFGIAAIFLIALLLVRYRRNKAKEEQQRQDALAEKRADSPASTVGSINAARGRSPFENGQTPQISRPAIVPQTQAEDLAPPRKLGQDDEWGRYFNNNNTVENLYPGSHGESHVAGAAIGGAAVGAAAGVGLAAAARNTQYTVGSEYTIDSPTSSSPHESAYVQPLHLRSSSYGQLEHARPFSEASSNNRDTFLNSSSGQGSWEPTSSFGSSSNGRPASSIYPADRASSVYPANPLSPNTMGNFPPVPMRPTTSGNDKGMRSIISTDFGNGSPTAQNGGTAFSESAARRVTPGSEPRSAGSGTGHSEKDLSWLQIGSAN